MIVFTNLPPFHPRPPLLELLPQARFRLDAFRYLWGIPRRPIGRRASGVEIPRLRKPIISSSSCYLFPGPLLRPFDCAASYPVVRLTFEAPVPDRWVQRNRLAVTNELPIRGAQRSNDFFATPAATLMDHCRKLHGHVECSLLLMF